MNFIINFATITERTDSLISWYSGTGMTTYFDIEIVRTARSRATAWMEFIGDMQNVELNCIVRCDFPLCN